MGTDWQGEWNLPLSDISDAKMGGERCRRSIPKRWRTSPRRWRTGNTATRHGRSCRPPGDSFVVSGIEEVWLHKTTTEDFLAELDKTFQQEKSDGKVPAIPDR